MLRITEGRANPLMDRKVVEVVFFEWLQWLQRSPHPQLLDAVWCSAVVVVVWCNGVVVAVCNKCSVVAVAVAVVVVVVV